MESTEFNQRTSETCTGHLVRAMMIGERFCPADHVICMAAGKTAEQDRKDEASTTHLDQVCASVKKAEQGTIRQGGGQKGAWLSVMPAHVNGIVLGCQEWCDALNARYACISGDLPDTCGGCGVKHSLQHTLL